MVGGKFIKTVSSFHVEKVSKLKGEALEWLVGFTIKEYKTIPVERQKLIRDAIRKYCEEFYKVRRKFSIFTQDNQEYKFNVRHSEESKKRIKIKDFEGKCNFKVNYKEKNKTITFPCKDIKELKSFLFGNDFIDEILNESLITNKKMDFFRFVLELISFHEVKNKEITNLSSRDINQIIDYAKILKEVAPLGYITLIFNGWSNGWEDLVEGIKENYEVDIRLFSIKQWLKNFGNKTNIKIEYMIFSQLKLDEKIFKRIKESKISKYNLYLKTTEYDEEYKPFQMLISNDQEEINEFLKEKNGNNISS